MMRRPACSIMRRPAVAEPTAVRPGAEWLPDRARQAQSHPRGANANRAVAVRRSRQPSAGSSRPPAAGSRRPGAGSRQSPSLPPPQQQRASSCVAFCRRSVDARRPAASVLGAGSARARADSACTDSRACPLIQTIKRFLVHSFLEFFVFGLRKALSGKEAVCARARARQRASEEP